MVLDMWLLPEAAYNMVAFSRPAEEPFALGVSLSEKTGRPLLKGLPDSIKPIQDNFLFD